MIGKLLCDSGCTKVSPQSKVLTSGVDQSALDEHYIKLTWYAHQVTLMTLQFLEHKTYSKCFSDIHGPPKSQEAWDHLQFKYWSTIMEL